MYFSLPESIPPHPLGGTRVRRQWSAFIYMSLYVHTTLYDIFITHFCKAVFTLMQTSINVYK